MDMHEVPRELSLNVVYNDVHLIQLEGEINSGRWNGYAQAYTTAQQLAEFSATLARFADGSVDVVVFQAGADTGVGLVGLNFYSIDRSRHIACHVKLASGQLPDDHRPEQIWRMEVEVKVETWALIKFSQQLARMAREQSGRATLAIET
jgi:hypothetical protein